MQLDGTQLYRLRLEKGLTQARLAKNLGWSERTIQRAEAGEPVRNQVVANLAEHLGVRIDQLQAKPQEGEHETLPKAHVGDVFLLPCMSGRKFITAARSAEFLTIENDIEPTEENVGPVRDLLRLISRIFDDIRAPRSERVVNLTEEELMDAMLDANRILPPLKSLGIQLLLATYPCEHPTVRWDEFGDPYWATQHNPDGTADMTYTAIWIALMEGEHAYLRRQPEDHVDYIPF